MAGGGGVGDDDDDDGDDDDDDGDDGDDDDDDKDDDDDDLWNGILEFGIIEVGQRATHDLLGVGTVLAIFDSNQIAEGSGITIDETNQQRVGKVCIALYLHPDRKPDR